MYDWNIWVGILHEGRLSILHLYYTVSTVCCSVLHVIRWFAVWCSELQCVECVVVCCRVLQRVVVCAIASCISLLYRDTCLRLTGTDKGQLIWNFIIGIWACALVWVEIRSTSTHHRSTDLYFQAKRVMAENRSKQMTFYLGCQFLFCNESDGIPRGFLFHF